MTAEPTTRMARCSCGNENHSHIAAENAPHTHSATIPTAGDQAGAGSSIPNDVDNTPTQSVFKTFFFVLHLV